MYGTHCIRLHFISILDRVVKVTIDLQFPRCSFSMKSWSLSVLKRVSKLVYAFPTTQFATVMPVGRRPTWRSKFVAISGVMSSSIGVKSLAATLATSRAFHAVAFSQ